MDPVLENSAREFKKKEREKHCCCSTQSTLKRLNGQQRRVKLLLFVIPDATSEEVRRKANLRDEEETKSFSVAKQGCKWGSCQQCLQCAVWSVRLADVTDRPLPSTVQTLQSKCKAAYAPPPPPLAPASSETPEPRWTAEPVNLAFFMTCDPLQYDTPPQIGLKGVDSLLRTNAFFFFLKQSSLFFVFFFFFKFFFWIRCIKCQPMLIIIYTKNFFFFFFKVLLCFWTGTVCSHND